MSANIAKPGCRKDCRSTCATGAYGTYGRAGDVRRCEHGKVWLWNGEVEGRYFNLIDIWKRLSPVWNARQYRAAIQALSTGDSQ